MSKEEIDTLLCNFENDLRVIEGQFVALAERYLEPFGKAEGHLTPGQRARMAAITEGFGAALEALCIDRIGDFNG